MARTVRNPKIDTRTARLRLAARAEPYWTVISAGNALGYRRGAKGGTWIAKFRDEDGKRQLEALVAGPLDRPFIVLLEQDGADQADNGLLIGEDADDLGAALDLAVQPFQRIGRVDLRPVVFGEAHKSQHVGFGLVHQGGQLGDLGSDLIGDLTPLAPRGFGIFLGKRGGDEGGDDTTTLLAGVGRHIAHEVHAAALPGGVQHLGHRRLEALHAHPRSPA